MWFVIAPAIFWKNPYPSFKQTFLAGQPLGQKVHSKSKPRHWGLDEAQKQKDRCGFCDVSDVRGTLMEDHM